MSTATLSPHTRPCLAQSLRERALTTDQRMREVAKVTLDRMMEGAIHDPIDGGFFRFLPMRVFWSRSSSSLMMRLCWPRPRRARLEGIPKRFCG